MSDTPSWLAVVIGLVLHLFASTTSADELEVVSQWNLLTFDFPHDFPLHSFVPENTVFTGVTVADDRIFLAMPRLRKGVPATLGWIPKDTLGFGAVSPPIRAFPHWGWHNRAANCSGIISVYRTRLDECNRLWVLDSGVTTSLEEFTVLCPPKLLVFDLTADVLLRSITFPREVLEQGSLLTNLVIDHQPEEFSSEYTCDNVFVYMSDTAEPGLVVYNSARDTTWRITHPAMRPEQKGNNFNVAGERFNLMDGVIGLALSPESPRRHLYFQPLASDQLFSVPTAALRVGPPPIGQQVRVRLVGFKSSQAAGLAVDDKGQVYFSPVSETALVLYDPTTEDSKVIAYNPEWLQFVTDITIPKRGSDEIYMVTSRFQKFFLKTWDPLEINLRVLRVRRGNNLPTGPFHSLRFF